VWLDHESGFGLGFRRLAILDLSPAGHQPMESPGGRYVIAYNGEIYNFAALRRELEAAGETFVSNGDTEVLLRLLARDGPRALDRLVGMFAFALWDRERRSLLLVRDRLGIKPLLYAPLADGGIAFASEIDALRAHPGISLGIDPEALSAYLACLYVPAPATIHRGIRKLPPGHILEWRDGTTTIRPYWAPQVAGGRAPSVDDVVDELLPPLRSAVVGRMVADVPVGCFLSGGIDSSVIAALMAEEAGHQGADPIHTLTMTFAESAYDERQPAAEVASHVGSRHIELRAGPGLADRLGTCLTAFGEPFGNPTALLVDELAQQARRHFTVALAGDGGDEVFAGYPRYQGGLLTQRYRRLPEWLRRRVLAPAAGLIREDHSGRHAWRRVREFLAHVDLPDAEMYAAWVEYFAPAERQALLGLSAPPSRPIACLYGEAASTDPLNAMQQCDLLSFLPGNLLAYGDAMTMRHGLELRLPLIDHRVVESVATLAPQLRIAGGLKTLLRAVARRLLPTDIVDRPKRGFNPPLGRVAAWRPQASGGRADHAVSYGGCGPGVAGRRCPAGRTPARTARRGVEGLGAGGPRYLARDRRNCTVGAMIRERLALIRELPPAITGRIAAETVQRFVADVRQRAADGRRRTFATQPPPGALRPLVETIPLDLLRKNAGWIRLAAANYCRHRFDLLGSGWMDTAHGTACNGVDGVIYGPHPKVEADPDGRWLGGRVNDANLGECRRVWTLVDPGYEPIDWQLDVKSGFRWRVWTLVDPGYEPIDWQLDVKSGFRWREDTWSRDVPFGRLDNVDIRVPWELARMQHVATLAWAHALARAGDEGLEPADVYAREFRNQVLDFIATNPPRYGVNWRCTMDVAIRAANWVLGRDLFRAGGGSFDAGFETLFKRSLYDHGRHIVRNLEWRGGLRGNHYLANVVGLLLIAAALPRSEVIDAWLAFAAQELATETRHQFHHDGGNFEGSTSYHRLAAEVVAFATAVVVGLDGPRRRTLTGAKPWRLRTQPHRPLHPQGKAPGTDHFSRMERVAEFIAHTARPDGRMPLIGDDDSGRLFKLHPALEVQAASKVIAGACNLEGYRHPDNGPYLRERADDHRPTLAALAALVDRPDLAAVAGDGWIDAHVAAGLAGHASAPTSLNTAPARGVRINGGADLAASKPADPPRTVVIDTGKPGLRRGLTRFGYPDFGIWVFRSERLHLVVRCGPVGTSGGDFHAHNDQLEILLTVDGEDWLCDPGSYLYCPPRLRRDSYRSVAAHPAPRIDGLEPARLDLGAFWIGRECQGVCLHFDNDGFAGMHLGYGRPVRRDVAVGDSTITIEDRGVPLTEPAVIRCTDRQAARRALGGRIAASPAYGWLSPTDGNA